MRDGNRDRVIGLVTERAARTLCYYLSETNLNVYHWLMRFMEANPIPKVALCAHPRKLSPSASCIFMPLTLMLPRESFTTAMCCVKGGA